MMYMHYCKQCHRIHMLNGHKMKCPRCQQTLAELRISYMDYVHMDIVERSTFLEQCSDPNLLQDLSTTYRMFKYSKWYRNLMNKNLEFGSNTFIKNQEQSDDGIKNNLSI